MRATRAKVLVIWVYHMHIYTTCMHTYIHTNKHTYMAHTYIPCKPGRESEIGGWCGGDEGDGSGDMGVRAAGGLVDCVFVCVCVCLRACICAHVLCVCVC